jgi:hypothetical protein
MICYTQAHKCPYVPGVMNPAMAKASGIGTETNTLSFRPGGQPNSMIRACSFNQVNIQLTYPIVPFALNVTIPQRYWPLKISIASDTPVESHSSSPNESLVAVRLVVRRSPSSQDVNDSPCFTSHPMSSVYVSPITRNGLPIAAPFCKDS